MSKQTEALKLALEALSWFVEKEMTVGQRYTNEGQKTLDALESIREVLAQQKQEPVGEVSGYYEQGFTEHKMLYGKLHNQDLPVGTKLYTRPQAIEPLTDEEIDAVMPQPAEFGIVQPPWNGLDITVLRAMARAIEAAHGIKEQQ